jgi:hypothetical protein
MAEESANGSPTRRTASEISGTISGSRQNSSCLVPYIRATARACSASL